MDWTEFNNVFAMAGPTVLALVVVVLNRRDGLVDKVNEISERVARIEGILVKKEAQPGRR